MKNAARLTALILSFGVFAAPTQTVANPSAGTMSLASADTTAGPLSAFTPRPSKTNQISYEAWSDILGDLILYMGPSTRTKFRPGPKESGTRLTRFSTSPTRLEGNKVLYPHMKKNVRTALKDYVVELENVGNDLDISTLPRNEQLAYWINLHNLLVMSEIAENYPGSKRHPENIKPIEGSDTTLHTAKLVTINGIALSLKDIRERIVYPNWKNPDVAFAFYLGDSGGPSLPNDAYTASRLSAQIKANAEQFANSLRGMTKGKVSQIYLDIAPWYFPNFTSDLKAYFRTRQRDDVFAEYTRTGYQGVTRYDKVVNDITGGRGTRGPRALGQTVELSAFNQGRTLAVGIDTRQFLDARIEKVRTLRKMPWFNRSTVAIIDTETDSNIEVN